jgi:hypothetical protein
LTKRQALYGRAKAAKNGAKPAKNGANHFQKEDSYPRLYGILKAVHMVEGNLPNVYIEGIGRWWTKVNDRWANY